MVTVVEITPSAQAQPKSSASANNKATQIVLLFTNVYPFRKCLRHSHSSLYSISEYGKFQLFCIIVHSFGKKSKFFHNYLHTIVIKGN